MKPFRTIDELLSLMQREQRLVSLLFDYRRESCPYELALASVDNADARIGYLQKKGMLRINMDSIELEDTYCHFFEEVMGANEEITIPSVKDAVEAIREPIRFYSLTTRESQKIFYVNKERRVLNMLGQRIIHNVVALDNSTENAFKAIPDYEIKRQSLEHLLEKKNEIEYLMTEVEGEIEHNEAFFKVANNLPLSQEALKLRDAISDVKKDILHIGKEIIDFLNQRQIVNPSVKKLKTIAYYLETMQLREKSDIEGLADRWNPLWMEPRQKWTLLPSLEQIQETDLRDLLRRLGSEASLPKRRRHRVIRISPEECKGLVEHVDLIQEEEVYNLFRASGKDLLSVVQAYDFHFPVSFEQRVQTFCHIAIVWFDELEVDTERTMTVGGYEFPTVTCKH